MTALTSVGTDAAQDRSPRESRQRHDLAELGRLLALVIVAAAFRFPYLGAVPPGFQFDETYNALDALRIVEGARPIFLPANAGREVLFSYVQAPFVAALGPSAVALRLPSALFGTATVLLLYLFVRLWRPGNIRLAWFAGLALAIMYPHLHFSRYAIRSISIPFWLLPTLGALWIGLRDRRPLGFVCCGVGMAAMVWTHPVGRLIPFVVAAPTLYLAISRYRDDPKLARDHLVGLASAALVAMILFAPLARYYWRHPAHFVGHASDVSVLADRVSGGDVWGTLVQNALRLAGMFCVAGDREWIHNLPGRPILDPLMSVFSVVGLIAVARRFWARRHELQARGEAALLGAWFTVLLVPSLLSDMAPNFSRTIGLLPLVAIVVAVGLDAVARWLDSRGMKEFRPMVLALALVLSAAWTAWDYFVLFGRDAETPDHYDRDKIEAAQLVRELDRHDVVFMAPLWAQQSTIQLLTRDLDMRSVETDVATVFPRRDGARGVVYAFPPEQESLAEELAHRWPAWAQRDVRFDSRGRRTAPKIHP